MTVFYILFFLKSCYHIPINALENVNLRRNGFLDSPMELPGGFWGMSGWWFTGGSVLRRMVEEGQLWDDLGKTLRQLWDKFETTLRGLGDNFETTWRKLWDNFVVVHHCTGWLNMTTGSSGPCRGFSWGRLPSWLGSRCRGREPWTSWTGRWARSGGSWLLLAAEKQPLRGRCIVCLNIYKSLFLTLDAQMQFNVDLVMAKTISKNKDDHWVVLREVCG